MTHNSADNIVSCLEALTHEDCDVVVVDNASQDDTVAQVQAVAEHCALQLLRISRNIGFGAGVNQGVRATSGRILLLLNPDVVGEPGAVTTMLDCIDSTGAAAVGGALLQPNGEPQRGFVFRKLPTLSALLCETLLINNLWPRNAVNRRYRCLDADYSLQQEVEQPAGACLAITREAFDAIGGLDAAFFPVWFEDVDLCKRLADSCRRLIYCPAARFRHTGAHSVGKLSFTEKQLYWYGNMLRYARKHFPLWKVLALRLAIAKGMTLRWLAALFKKGPGGVDAREARAAYRRVIVEEALSRSSR